MSRKQLVVEQARRILGTYDAAAGAIAELNVGAALESMPTGFESTTRSASRTRSGPSAVAEATPVGRAIAEERAAQVKEGVEAMKKIELGRDDITPREQEGLEAIILLTGRPAILIQEGDFLEPPALWKDLKTVRAQIQAVIRRVGRIDVSGNPNFEWLGTGFLAGQNVVITNRHVAVEFSRRSEDGTWTFRTPMRASINLKAELGSEDALTFKVTSIVGIHEEHDMAALKVEQVSGSEQLPDPLPVAQASPSTLTGHKVYVIGYPAWDGRRNDPEPMKRIFADIYNVKRLQPGEVSGDAVDAFEIFHDCSTLGGNSGSPVIDLETHQVLGLHFGGRFLEKNHAVPLWTLQNDDLVKRAKLNFA
jgi:V8-like Glu-specific endopeptidase